MAGRGPAPKPTALKILAGNPGRRPINNREPRYRDSRPKCPDFLDDAAKEEWRRITKELAAVPGLIAKVDRSVIAAYCQTWSRWQAMEEILSEQGITYESGNMIRQRPEVAISHECLTLMKGFAQELGLSPASRTRLSIPQPHVETSLIAGARKRG